MELYEEIIQAAFNIREVARPLKPGAKWVLGSELCEDLLRMAQSNGMPVVDHMTLFGIPIEVDDSSYTMRLVNGS